MLDNFNKFIPKHSVSKGLINKGLGAINLLVYLGLKAKSNRKGYVEISYQELSEFVGLSKSGTQKAIYDLERAKVIKRLPPLFITAVPQYIVL